MPLASQPDVRDLLANPGEWERPLVRLIGRLANGRNAREAEAGLRPLDAQIRREFPRENAPAGEITVAVAAGATLPEVRETATPMAVLLLSVTAVVLLIACVNVANLILSRAAVRRALGAGPWRLARQTLAEGVVLAAGGAALGLVVGYWSGRLLARNLPGLPHGAMLTLRLDLDWRVAAFAAAAGLASAVLFTLAPAIDTARINGGGSRRMRQRDVYVVAQVALADRGDAAGARPGARAGSPAGFITMIGGYSARAISEAGFEIVAPLDRGGSLAGNTIAAWTL